MKTKGPAITFDQLSVFDLVSIKVDGKKCENCDVVEITSPEDILVQVNSSRGGWGRHHFKHVSIANITYLYKRSDWLVPA